MGKSTDDAGAEHDPADLSKHVEAWLAELHQADETFYSMMSIEIWAIAQTMDEIKPGFWSQFMRNRQTIVKQQIQERKRRYEETVRARKLGASASRLFSPLNQTPEPAVVPNSLGRMDLFSQTLGEESPGLKNNP